MNCSLLCKWHENSLNVILHLAAFILLIFGLWYHDIGVVIAALMIGLIGHLIEMIKKKKQESAISAKKKRR